MATSIRSITSFGPETLSWLGNLSYVYALIDPRLDSSDPKRIFYVGKGAGNRCFAHAQEELKRRAKGEPSLKRERIRAIRTATSAPPPIVILDSGLTDTEARRLESILIKLLKTDANIASGKGAASFCLRAEEFDAKHSNPIHPSELGATVLLVNLSGGGRVPPWPEIAKEDIPRRVLGHWPVSEANAKQVDYVIGVYRQVVVCVFKTLSGPGRYTRRNHADAGGSNWKIEFHGHPDRAKEGEWAYRSIVDDEGAVLTKFNRQVGRKLIRGTSLVCGGLDRD